MNQIWGWVWLIRFREYISPKLFAVWESDHPHFLMESEAIVKSSWRNIRKFSYKNIIFDTHSKEVWIWENHLTLYHPCNTCRVYILQYLGIWSSSSSALLTGANPGSGTGNVLAGLTCCCTCSSSDPSGSTWDSFSSSTLFSGCSVVSGAFVVGTSPASGVLVSLATSADISGCADSAGASGSAVGDSAGDSGRGMVVTSAADRLRRETSSRAWKQSSCYHSYVIFIKLGVVLIRTGRGGRGGGEPVRRLEGR